MNPDEFESTTSYAYDPHAEIPWPDNNKKEICWIVAGSKAEFDEYVKKKKQQAAILRQELMVEYRYVSGVDSIRGYTITKGFYIGSYKRRPDIQDITDHINIAKARVHHQADVTQAATELSRLIDQETLQQALKRINGGQIGNPSV